MAEEAPEPQELWNPIEEIEGAAAKMIMTIVLLKSPSFNE